MSTSSSPLTRTCRGWRAPRRSRCSCSSFSSPSHFGRAGVGDSLELPRARTLWLAATASLLGVFGAQESAEWFLAHGHLPELGGHPRRRRLDRHPARGRRGRAHRAAAARRRHGAAVGARTPPPSARPPGAAGAPRSAPAPPGRGALGPRAPSRRPRAARSVLEHLKHSRARPGTGRSPLRPHPPARALSRRTRSRSPEPSRAHPSPRRTEHEPSLRIAVVTAIAAAGLPAVAPAHVTLQPNEVPAGGFKRLDVRVPNERDDASTKKVEVQFPAGFISVSHQPVAGLEREGQDGQARQARRGLRREAHRARRHRSRSAPPARASRPASFRTSGSRSPCPTRPAAR